MMPALYTHTYSVPSEEERRKLQGMRWKEELKKMVKFIPIDFQMMLDHYAQW